MEIVCQISPESKIWAHSIIPKGSAKKSPVSRTWPDVTTLFWITLQRIFSKFAEPLNFLRQPNRVKCRGFLYGAVECTLAKCKNPLSDNNLVQQLSSSILLSIFFSSTVRKNWEQRFIYTVKGRNNFWNKMLFKPIPGVLSDLKH